MGQRLAIASICTMILVYVDMRTSVLCIVSILYSIALTGMSIIHISCSNIYVNVFAALLLRQSMSMEQKMPEILMRGIVLIWLRWQRGDMLR